MSTEEKTPFYMDGGTEQFKYEAEATAKIFLAAERFDFRTYTPVNKNGNFIYVTCKKIDDVYLFAAEVQIEDKHAFREEATGSDEKDVQEKLLCSLIYGCLAEITKKKPEWGLITGIRPVKKVNELALKGVPDKDIKTKLKKEYGISDKKLDLCIDVSRTQRKYLEPKGKHIGFYVSIPFCPARCSYCSFVSESIEKSAAYIEPYIEKLCNEIRMNSVLMKRYGLTADSIYIGGGTPTILSPVQLETLLTTINDTIPHDEIREFSVEAGRPDTITQDKLDTLKSNGVTRISVNAQTTNDEVLKRIGRTHTAQQFLEALQMAKNTGFACVNTDIIAGLPGDNEAGFKNTLDTCLAYNPENITVHTLTLKRSADLFAERKNIEYSHADKMIDYSVEKLKESGYSPYYLYRQKNSLDGLENTGWSVPGKESVYNILIMDETQTILAAGAGASTKIVQRNGKITRVHNFKFAEDYIRNFDTLAEKKKQIKEIIDGEY